jgi:hypothetical protein
VNQEHNEVNEEERGWEKWAKEVKKVKRVESGGSKGSKESCLRSLVYTQGQGLPCKACMRRRCSLARSATHDTFFRQ